MRKKNLLLSIIILSSGIFVSCTNNEVKNYEKNEHINNSQENAKEIKENIPIDYYKSTEGKGGEALKDALNDIIDNHTELSYKAVYDALEKTDEDPHNPGNVILLYTGFSYDGPKQYDNAKGWNREHVWAKSHGDFGTNKGAGSDLHHLRPAHIKVNQDRGHLDFDNGGKSHKIATECKYDNDSWEPRDAVKGDVARMIFYMAVRYEGEHGEIDLKMENNVNSFPKPMHGKVSTLLEWNEKDPVDEFEMRRNNIIFKDYQHNRNPFIDHPEFAEMIWGAAS